MSAWGFFPAQQNRLISVTGIANTPMILSLNASFMYLGFALGAGLGSLVLSFVGVAGAFCVIGAMILSQIAWTQAGATVSGETAFLQ